jgi:hypothetical protein
VLGKRHSVSLEISDIAANGDGGEESEEGKSESEEDMDQEDDKETIEDKIEERQDSIGISRPCRPNIGEVENHN